MRLSVWVLVGAALASSGCAMRAQMAGCPSDDTLRTAARKDALAGALTGAVVLSNAPRVLGVDCQTLGCRAPRDRARGGVGLFFLSVLSALYWKSALSDDFRRRECTVRAAGGDEGTVGEAPVTRPRTGPEAGPSRSVEAAPRPVSQSLARATGYPVRLRLVGRQPVEGRLALFNGFVAVVDRAGERVTVRMDRVVGHVVFPKGYSFESAGARDLGSPGLIWSDESP